MNILVTTLTTAADRAALEAIAPEAVFRHKDMYDKNDVTQEDVDWAHVLLGNVPAGMIAGAPRIQWLQTSSAGVEPYVVPGALAANTLLTNASGAYGLAISEHMLGMLLSIQKKLTLYRDAQHKKGWASLGKVRSLTDATVVVLGMGDIGSEFGKRCKALGARVIGVRRRNAEKPDYADEVYLIDALDEVLQQADVLAVTLPGTPETRNMIGKRELALLRDEAIVLNVGRGYIIETEALCDALESGKLMGAGLDVIEPEPLPADHRLWEIPTALITPHISGFFHLAQTQVNILNIFKENLRRFVAGEALINQVDRGAGY